MLIDLPPGTGDIPADHAVVTVTGAVVVSTPQAVALADAKKGVSMFLSAINVPVLEFIENMAYFTRGATRKQILHLDKKELKSCR
jgi:ATP-binding protein involved in chromosome partitioning